MRTALDALVTEKTLAAMSVGRNAEVLDWVLDGGDGNFPVKNVCAKVAPQLSDEIDNICGVLSISKRRFLEAAFIDAVKRAHTIMRDEGLWEVLNEAGQATPVEQDCGCGKGV